MSFRITGVAAGQFGHLFGLPDADLARHHARRCVADAPGTSPDRIELRHATPGESLLLVNNHTHPPADNPYRAAHGIFVLEGAHTTFDRVGVVSEVLRPRVLSLRAFDASHLMLNADLVDGREVESLIERLLADPQVASVHAQHAKRGCYARRIDRPVATCAQ